MSDYHSPFWWIRYVPVAILLILTLDLVYVVGAVAIVPVMASFALAYVLNPLVELIQQRGASRAVAALLALTLVASVFLLFAFFVIPDLWDQTVDAGDKIEKNLTPQNAEQLRIKLRRVAPVLDRIAGSRITEFAREFKKNPGAALGLHQGWSAGALTTFLSTAAASFDLFLIPFFVYYILVDWPKWRSSAEQVIPPRFRGPLQRLFDEIGRILQAYVLGQLMIAMLMGLMYALGFAMLGVPAWAGIASLSGLLNVIPYVGTTLGLILATGLTYAQTAEWWRVLGVISIFVIVQCVEGYYLTPRILGGRLALHPMAVFLGLLVGGRLFGFLGIILAVPAIAVCTVLLKLVRELYKNSYFYHEGDINPDQTPSPHLEEQLAKATDQVLTEQVDEQTGDELLTPNKEEDDVAARR